MLVIDKNNYHINVALITLPLEQVTYITYVKVISLEVGGKKRLQLHKI